MAYEGARTMDRVVENAMVAVTRQWIAEKHLVNILEKGEWTEMFDADGRLLLGIRGKVGVGEMTAEGRPIGADFIEMQPGSAFPPHEHPGDHILYFVSGQGRVLIDDGWQSVRAGDLIFIAAEHPHAVQGPPEGATEPLCIVSVGYPHTHVGSKERMHHPHTHYHHGHDHDHDH